MANEITLDFGTLNLNSTNNIAIGKISVKESKSLQIHDIPKADGTIAEEAKKGYLTIDITGDIAGSDYDDLRSNLDTLKAGLADGFQKFTTDDDRYIMAQLKNFTVDYVSLRTLATWKATFIAHFPFWLAESLSSDDRTPTSGSGYTINNAGNAPARVRIVATAPGGGISDNFQFENTTNGQLCKYRGDVSGSNDLEIDNRVNSDDFAVLNDGASDFPNFEGDFITLEPGDNTVEFTGEASTQIVLYWRATYH